MRKHLTILLFGLFSNLWTSTARADALIPVNTPTSQGAADSVSWSRAGEDGTLVQRQFDLSSMQGLRVSTELSGDGSVLSVVCPASPCGWKGSGFATGETLLWASDTRTGGNGPIRLMFPAGVQGVGARIQPDVPGAFTGRIEAFAGQNSLGFQTFTSDFGGGAVYAGIRDMTAPNVTSVVFSITDCVERCSDFAIGSVQLDAGTAKITVSPMSLDFGKQSTVAASAPRTVTVTNTGAGSGSLNIAVTGDFRETHTCGSSLTSASSCTVAVTFAPAAAGLRSGTLTLGNRGPAVVLTGEGVTPDPARITISQLTLNFGQQTITAPSAAKVVAVTNSGGLPGVLNISVTSPYKETHTCGASLPGGSSCTVSVSFAPGDIGVSARALTIGDGLPTVALWGEGVDSPRSGNLLTTDSADRLSWKYEPDVAARDRVEFRICQAPPITWRKALAIRRGNILLVDIDVTGSPMCSTGAILLTNLQGTLRVELWKAKFLGIPAKVKDFPLSDYMPLRGGSRLTFTWKQD